MKRKGENKSCCCLGPERVCGYGRGGRRAYISWKAGLMWFGELWWWFVEVWSGLVEVWGVLVEVWGGLGCFNGPA